MQMTGLVSVGSPKSLRVVSITTICANRFGKDVHIYNKKIYV